MRELDCKRIEDAVARLCVEANLHLPAPLRTRLLQAEAAEESASAKEILKTLLRNLEAAERLRLPICQDTGMAVVFADLGQEVHITGGDFTQAVTRGVAKGYKEGFLRCSIAEDPLRRKNTGDNTPPVVHLRLVPGDTLRLAVAPKGFGSENMSRLQMLTPADDADAVVAFVLETVRLAGSNPCPPIVLGVGLGGNFESCALLAKRALCRAAGQQNADPYYAALEARILREVNALGIGPQGFGGRTTALWAAVEAAPTHIAGLPVSVNIGCHVTRHAETVLA
ncbi:MAG: fumarate hydratase [Oscillospiraceae bacterium]|nr:fumarate hydratase [Oscillospiraceae bacterium]